VALDVDHVSICVWNFISLECLGPIGDMLDVLNEVVFLIGFGRDMR